MKVVNKVEESGRLVYNSDIVRDIVACALHEIKGIIMYEPNSKQERESIKVDMQNEEVYVDVFVKLRFDVEVNDVASTIQSTIHNTVEAMTEFKVKDVNVHVLDIGFDEN
jgi:uncharacterized alkaline shock family protein YloU